MSIFDDLAVFKDVSIGGSTRKTVWRNWLRQTHGNNYAELYTADEDDFRGDVPTWMKRHDQQED